MFTIRHYTFARTLLLLALVSAPAAAIEKGGTSGVLTIPLAGTVFFGPDTIALSGDGRIRTKVVMKHQRHPDQGPRQPRWNRAGWGQWDRLGHGEYLPADRRG